EFLKNTIIDRIDYDREDIDEAKLPKDEKEHIEELKEEHGVKTSTQLAKVFKLFNEYRLRKTINKLLKETGREVSAITRERMFYYAVRDLMGYGKIDPMMNEPQLEDISCDGVNLPLYVFHREFKNIKTNTLFKEAEELDSFVIFLAQKSGKNISISHPVLDATLPDGSRLNQTLGTEVTTRGSSFTIRKFKEDPLTISDLVKFRTLSPEMAAHLWLAVQFGESFIVSGGTASGKTTTLNAISHFIPPASKIITIEDTREMNLPHENWVAGLTREKKGTETTAGASIDMYALLVAALRQRPEYMIVGEVRGAEAMAIFQAMATGQITYSTIHADSITSIVHRLENPPINIPRILLLGLNLIAIQAQVRVKNQRTRRIKEMVEIIGIEPTSNEIVTNTVYKWLPARDEFKYSGHSKLYEKIMERENISATEVIDEVDRRSKIIKYMVKKGVREHRKVASIVNEYYRDPNSVMNRIKKEMAEMIEEEEAKAKAAG
ncbi:MAG: type II/IV secretion system ATPase subunit, partial [Thermoplasmata archaeon]|nr:type II/IV secretion system ATPase subunit [Thermoplasmata archaeon]